MNLIERFIRYIQIDTQSDPNSESTPSTSKQLNLARLLQEEMKSIGLSHVSLDEKGYLTATLPANHTDSNLCIGFIAHMDTSCDMSGADVQPQIIKNYDGKKITLNTQQNIFLDPIQFPELADYIGQDLITTDGTTLLGADDKAGITEILCAMEYLLQHPEIAHPKIRIGFTPDEEIGRGADHFQVKEFGADFAYTVDGSAIGELEYENFNAAQAKIFVQGCNVHPGTAKNKMRNAISIAMEYHQLLPSQMVPEHTEHYEGFIHLIKMQGTVENAELTYIVRDHDMEQFKQKKSFMQECQQFINKKYGETISLELTDQYYNMKEKIDPVKHIVELAAKSMEDIGIAPVIKPIRGGTDGARLSFMGLPTPNLFAGGHNFHGKYEFIPIQSMEKAVELLVRIAENAIKK